MVDPWLNIGQQLVLLALNHVGTDYQHLRVCNNWNASKVAWWDLCLANKLWFLGTIFLRGLLDRGTCHVFGQIGTCVSNKKAIESIFCLETVEIATFRWFRVLTTRWNRYWRNRFNFRFVPKSSVILMRANLVNEQNWLNLQLLLFSQLTYWNSVIILTDLTAHFYSI